MKYCLMFLFDSNNEVLNVRVSLWWHWSTIVCFILSKQRSTVKSLPLLIDNETSYETSPSPFIPNSLSWYCRGIFQSCKPADNIHQLLIIMYCVGWLCWDIRHPQGNLLSCVRTSLCFTYIHIFPYNGDPYFVWCFSL